MEFIDKLVMYTQVKTKDSTTLTHGIHPYPAKYIPILPREIITECTKERNVILDPFCGSGTTLLEACLAGRKSIGIDSNPIATLISKAKTTALSNKEIRQIENIIEDLCSIDFTIINSGWIPVTDNLDHWFQRNVIRELSWLKEYIISNSYEDLRDFLLCIFSSIIVTVSNQESNTRYAAIQKNLKDGFVISSFLRKLKAMYPRIKTLSKNQNAVSNRPTIIQSSAEDVDSSIIPDNSVDIIITSPPYANTYDYYLYHKWRMLWLGYDVKSVQDNEIGSRHEHSSKKAPLSVFEERMAPVMENLSRMLKPNKLAYFFVGDSVIAGEFIDMSECFKRIGEQGGFKFVEGSKYSLKSVSRSFHEKQNDKHKKMQHILVFEPVKTKSILVTQNSVIAKPKSELEIVNLLKSEPTDGSVISIQNSETTSKLHSIGKYPAKFIPDIPLWAIQNYSKSGDLVLDPFNGCGTTCVEAKRLGRNAIGIDVSPYACMLARVKTATYASQEIRIKTDAFQEFLSDRRNIKTSRELYFENDTFWFSNENLIELESIKDYIYKHYNGTERDYFLAVLSTIIKPCSYLDEGQIKVKRDQKKLLRGVPGAFNLMSKMLSKYLTIITENEWNNKNTSVSVFNESSLNMNHCVSDSTVDLIVTSPPYINAMNYPMNNRYESFLLSLVNPEESLKYQTKFIGTERVYAKDYRDVKQFDRGTLLAEELNDKLVTIFQKEPKRSYIVYKYFEDMNIVFNSAIRALKKEGYFVLVAGTNKIRNVEIDTVGILVKMLNDKGLICEKTFKYEIVKNTLKIKRHKTSDIIKYDGVAVLRRK